MFRKNDTHNQLDLFGICAQLNKSQQKLWNNSREHYFYKNIFSLIDESKFAVLFSNKKSRPNTPINQLVGALILKHLYDWTFNELFTQLNFNSLTRHAIGVHSLDEPIFCKASIFNFQGKLIDHLKNTGEDLIEQVFTQLTDHQIKEMGVDTSIQRGDSFLVGSNITDYTRLGLLVEVIKRLSRVLSKEDKEVLDDYINVYTENTSINYIYHVEKENLEKELKSIALVYQQIHQVIGNRYAAYDEFIHFYRVWKEHFDIGDKQLKVRPSKELHSGILMSPDDDEATYRYKRTEKSKGYVAHLSETANPENSVNLITDICVYPNNIGDAEILENRLPIMIQRTPELGEYFIDGQYGSYEVDKIADDHQIVLYQKTSRGRKSKVGVSVYRDEELNLKVSCAGGQVVDAEKQEGRKNYRAYFNLNHCVTCPLQDVCNMKRTRGEKEEKRKVYYFTEKKIKAQKRLANIEKLDKNGKKRFTRANVEATVKENKRGMKNNKVRVRRRISVSLHMIFTAMAINLTRLHKRKLKKLCFGLQSLHGLAKQVNGTTWHFIKSMRLFWENANSEKISLCF